MVQLLNRAYRTAAMQLPCLRMNTVDISIDDKGCMLLLAVYQLTNRIDRLAMDDTQRQQLQRAHPCNLRPVRSASAFVLQ